MPKRSNKNTRHLMLYFAAGLAVLVLIIQAALIKQLYTRTDELQIQTMKDVLVDAVKAQNRSLVVEPQTGRYFIPSVHIVLPPKIETEFYYRAGAEDSSLLLTYPSNQSQAITKLRNAKSITEVFAEIANVQACSRQIVVSLNVQNPKDSTDKLTLVNTKKLKDGRTAYIYQNQCPYGPEPLLRSLDQMESF